MATKALIIVLDEKNKEIKRFPVLFNPSEYSYTREAKYSNKEKGSPQFQGFDLQSFTISLFYDTYESGKDVRTTYTDDIANLTEPAISGQKSKRPPVCIFSWGQFNIKGTIQKVEQKFTMFLDTGIPVRAQLTITFNPVATAKEIEELTGTQACRKIWTVKSGDRLDLIAADTLKDPGLWRTIADLNKISNPLTFPTQNDIGRRLIIPDLQGEG